MKIYKDKDCNYRLVFNDFELLVLSRCMGRMTAETKNHDFKYTSKIFMNANLFTNINKALKDTHLRTHNTTVSFFSLTNFVRTFDIDKYCWFAEERKVMENIYNTILKEIRKCNPNFNINN